MEDGVARTFQPVHIPYIPVQVVEPMRWLVLCLRREAFLNYRYFHYKSLAFAGVAWPRK